MLPDPFIDRPSFSEVQKSRMAIKSSPRKVDQKLLDRLTKLETLYKTTTRLNTTLETDKLLQLVLRAAVKSLKASSGSLLLLEPGGQVLCFKVATGLKKKEIERRKIPLGEGVTGWVALHGKPLRIPTFSQTRSTSRSGNRCSRRWPPP